MQELENKLCKAMTAKEKAVSLLCKVRLSRNKQKEKTVAAKGELKEVKIKNTALGKQLSAEKIKSAETNHRAWLDKKANLTLLTNTTKSHQVQIEKLNEELSAETLLRSYMKRKQEKNW